MEQPHPALPVWLLSNPHDGMPCSSLFAALLTLLPWAVMADFKFHVLHLSYYPSSPKIRHTPNRHPKPSTRATIPYKLGCASITDTGQSTTGPDTMRHGLQFVCWLRLRHRMPLASVQPVSFNHMVRILITQPSSHYVRPHHIVKASFTHAQNCTIPIAVSQGTQKKSQGTHQTTILLALVANLPLLTSSYTAKASGLRRQT